MLSYVNINYIRKKDKAQLFLFIWAVEVHKVEDRTMKTGGEGADYSSDPA